jgi:two-component system, OmpR family, response regulator
MRILVVEDDPRIATAIKTGLEEERYAVDVASDGEMGLDLASSEDYDCIVLDLMLPKMNGTEVCATLRKDGINIPILMLTARGTLNDKVAGLNTGADDYLVKPFAFDELVARIRALTRRTNTITKTSTLAVSDLTLDSITFIVTRDHTHITLSKKEFSILQYLMQNTGNVISKDQLIAHVWDYQADVLENTVEVNIRNLRKKLGKPDLIKTIRGFGYRIGDQ